MIYQWEGLTERIAIMQFDGNMTPNAAAIEAVKTMFPADYCEIVKICIKSGLNPEAEIYTFINNMETERKQQPRTLAQSTKREIGLEALKNYVRGTV